MLHARAVRSAGSWDPASAAEEIALSYDGRHRRRLVLATARGERFLLDLPDARALRDGDGLVLDDGRVVRVVASDEPVADVSAAPHLLLRVAWHIGNRHVPCQLLEGRLRIARDHVLEAMVRGLGATVERVEAPFQPEAGAYAGEGHGHAHAGGHVHGGAHEHGAAHDHANDGEHDHADGHEAHEHRAGHGHAHASGDGHAHAHAHGHEHEHGDARSDHVQGR